MWSAWSPIVLSPNDDMGVDLLVFVGMLMQSFAKVIYMVLLCLISVVYLSCHGWYSVMSIEHKKFSHTLLGAHTKMLNKEWGNLMNISTTTHKLQLPQNWMTLHKRTVSSIVTPFIYCVMLLFPLNVYKWGTHGEIYCLSTWSHHGLVHWRPLLLHIKSHSHSSTNNHVSGKRKPYCHKDHNCWNPNAPRTRHTTIATTKERDDHVTDDSTMEKDNHKRSST